MPTRTCWDCGLDKELCQENFYVNLAGKEGFQQRCKVCSIKAAKKRYDEKRAEIAEYEQKRFKDPARKAKVAEYQRRRRARYPEKNRARQKVAYAIRTGKLARKPCERCGNPKAQTHHADYSRPLEVTWLCFACHRECEHGQTVNR